MKLFIASDIHGSAANLERFFTIVDEALAVDRNTKVVLLGDTYNHGPRNPFPDGYAPMLVARLLNDAMSFVTVIKGNCDSEVDEMISNFPIVGDFSIEWEGRTIYFTHGHKCNPDSPSKDAKAGDIVFYGHFHCPQQTVVDGVTYICVGSIGLPFKESHRAYAILSETDIQMKTFEGETLFTIKL